MERELFVLLMRAAAGIEGLFSRPARASYRNNEVFAVLLWAALHDRPISWAVQRRHWPLCDHRRRLPSSATMSRRLRDPLFVELLDRLIAALRVPGRGERTLMLDGRPLTIARHSADKDAEAGRAAGGLGRGYKLHLAADLLGNCRGFRVTSLRVSEQAAAKELIGSLRAGECDHLLADAYYDTNDLYELAGQSGIQMLAGRRYPQAKGVGHRKHSEHRLRALRMLKEQPELLSPRRRIEGVFGTQGNVVGGLWGLPNHVRGLRRVTLWVASKLAIDAAHRFRRHNLQPA